jgi:hypothetical protein
MSGKPIGYTARPVARRATRPLHRREAILAAAEAVFEKKTATMPVAETKPEAR